MSTLLECKGLFKSYSGRPALKNVNLAIESGHIVGLLGPNGSGKTTLIKLINGLLTPTQGELYINQNPVGVESKKIVSYLPDHTYLDMNLKVRILSATSWIFMKILTKRRHMTCSRS